MIKIKRLYYSLLNLFLKYRIYSSIYLFLYRVLFRDKKDKILHSQDSTLEKEKRKTRSKSDYYY